MSKDWDSLSRSEKKEEGQKTLRKLKRQKTKKKKKIIIFLLFKWMGIYKNIILFGNII